ncbi:heat shock protein, HSP70, hsc70 [Thalassiosira pseudonana CCMP1335]|uniref:Heat shock protein, HSP70, hsc70 n=1 Tax=Thalassiosira pseudonana TaxID=35128 RepID=B8C1V0_THAPS|nr:heat shock protein, HSP70, hsc70 [Thalassiosira pseudonana CCMP1335]EED92282.1 heat shock protein, HSP70, hsc70 [Thalassiosira pseudonana CCMP1335]|eukprot:g9346.t1 g9346   contig36:383909-386178(+)
MSAEPIIGIDLGTTFSCVACWDDKTNKVEVIESPSGRTCPSWVSFTKEGKLVGTAAKSQVASNPRNTVYDIKRIIGRSFTDPVTAEECKNFPFEVSEGGAHGEPKIVVEWRGEKKELRPEEISAMVLAELKLAAERHLGREVKGAVITVPAHFNNQQRQATKDAGRIAGLDVKRIINEPTAAALSYGLHAKKEREESGAEQKKANVVIFDLGGGTFDVSVLAMDSGVFEVKATGGDTHLGGEDFDNSVMKWCLEQIKAKNADVWAKLQDNPRAQSRLRRAVENAKRTLSSSMSTEIEVDSLVGDFDFTVTLDRAKFEELNAVLFKRCIDTVNEVLNDAGCSQDEVTDLVLVGGSTRIPSLQTSLYDMFGGRIELCKSVHPDEAVAHGAAVQGHILATGGSGGGQDLAGAEMTTDLLLLDVTPLSLGIELEGKQMSTLIKRNTAIPCKKTRTYTTVDDWQTEIDVVVFEGERPHVDANNKLGSFVISGVQRARAGEPKVDVTFALDANGILNVSARDQVTGAEARAEIKAEKGRLTSDDIDKMIEDAEKYRAQDEELTEKTDYKASLEEALFTVQSKVAETNKSNEVKELADLMDWLELDSDTATLEDMKKRGRIVEDTWGIIVA